MTSTPTNYATLDLQMPLHGNSIAPQHVSKVFRRVRVLDTIIKNLSRVMRARGEGAVVTRLLVGEHCLPFAAEKVNRETLARLYMFITSRACITENLTDHIENGAKHECHDLLRQLHDILPLELRDHIYGYFVGGRTVEVTKDDIYHRSACGIQGVFHEPTINSLLGKDFVKHGYGHLLSAGMVSADEVLFELVAPWYKTSTFRFVEPLDLQDFIKLDYSGAEMNPIRLIKHVEYCLNHDSNDYGFEKQDQIHKGFNALHYLGTDAKITVTPLYNDQYGSPTDLIRSMEPYFPDLEYLVNRNYKVNVKLTSEFEFEISKDELTVECWDAKVQVFQSNARAKYAPMTRGLAWFEWSVELENDIGDDRPCIVV